MFAHKHGEKHNWKCEVMSGGTLDTRWKNYGKSWNISDRGQDWIYPISVLIRRTFRTVSASKICEQVHVTKSFR